MILYVCMRGKRLAFGWFEEENNETSWHLKEKKVSSPIVAFTVNSENFESTIDNQRDRS